MQPVQIEKRVLETLVQQLQDGWRSGKLFAYRDKNDVELVSTEEIANTFFGTIRTTISKIETMDLYIIDSGSRIEIVPKRILTIIQRLEFLLEELKKSEEDQKNLVNA